MTVKVILLKSGEDVISDAKEILDKEREGIIAYHLTNPYVMQLTSRVEESDEITEEGTEPQSKTTFSVQYTHWAPLAKQREFVIPADWVVTIYDPHDNILRDYCSKHNIQVEEISNAGSETTSA
jgi:hypothetical protein